MKPTPEQQKKEPISLKQVLSILIPSLLFALAIYLQFVGRNMTSQHVGLYIQLGSLVIILVLLWAYNRKYR